GIEQADALDVRARQERPEGAAEDVSRAEEQHELGVGAAAPAAGRRRMELAIEHEPERDVPAADRGQHGPPPGHRIRPRPPQRSHTPLRVMKVTLKRHNSVTSGQRSRGAVNSLEGEGYSSGAARRASPVAILTP